MYKWDHMMFVCLCLTYFTYHNALNGFLGGSDSKESACDVRDLGSILGSGRSPGEATHSSVLVWRISRTEEPGGLQSVQSQRVRHNWATNTQCPWCPPMHLVPNEPFSWLNNICVCVFPLSLWNVPLFLSIFIILKSTLSLIKSLLFSPD